MCDDWCRRAATWVEAARVAVVGHRGRMGRVGEGRVGRVAVGRSEHRGAWEAARGHCVREAAPRAVRAGGSLRALRA